MVEIVWTEPALAELDAIADYIAFENPEAARRFVKQLFTSVRQLTRFPKSGSPLPEWPKSAYRQLVVNPCRVFYRHEGNKVFIIFVMRQERLLRKSFLKEAK